jgi:hypothetical protein
MPIFDNYAEAIACDARKLSSVRVTLIRTNDDIRPAHFTTISRSADVASVALNRLSVLDLVGRNADRILDPLSFEALVDSRHGEGVSINFRDACYAGPRTRSVLTGNFAGEEDEMSDELLSRGRYGEAFWRAHHEAWRRSELNQRESGERGLPTSFAQAGSLKDSTRSI